ncbi:polyphosphate kinase 1 [Thalassotalea sp. PLHSN55]|uniref:polyphosphate kinase 1 n=1 Tax=Thalassotalea sp. PLHSN55 TaxID=3435888 RepID=UPI003F82665A
MTDLPQYFDKELSWLSFNERVLQEAADASVPIVERIKFLGIYSANLNEFFRVRVASIRREVLVERAKESNQNDKELLLADINKKVNHLSTRFKAIADDIFEQLHRHHIHVIFNSTPDSSFTNNLTNEHLKWLKAYFDNRIIRHIAPIIITADTNFSDVIDDESIYFLAALKHNENIQYALVEIPTTEEKRFIVLPNKGSKKEKYIVMLDDVVHFFINDIFTHLFQYDTIEAFSIKLTRDSEYNLTDELDKSLLDKMSKGLKQRLKADVVRLVHDKNMPDYMLKFIKKSLKIKASEKLEAGVKYRNFKDFTQFPNLGRKQLENPTIKALDSTAFLEHSSVFKSISQQDILLYYPYYKFRHFTEFIRQASYDPKVIDIKINIYRVAKDSRIINSLIEAVKNGKKVTVVVELRARFDEQANIEWAKKMKDAGIHVDFGIDTLKIHSKLCVITRIEQEKKVQYAHIGTGNFHENNARIYTDFALFTKHKEICQEVEQVFSFISHSYKRFRFNHLIVSPLTSRRRLYQLIDNEIAFAEQGLKAEITIKVNNLVDKGLVNKLYAANNAGVKIRLIVRGMCALVPGVKGQSENIKAISIIDQFLEHPRVMVFENNKNKLVFISSADWMERNLDHRVEVACPVYDETLQKRIIHTLDLHFKDTTKARVINQSQNNRYVARGNRKKIRSQLAIFDYLSQEEQSNEDLLAND